MQRIVIPDHPVDPATAALAPGRPLRHASGETMGTSWSVQWHARDGAVDPRIAIEAALSSVVEQMSTWRDDSVITRFNDAEPDEWQAVPADFCEVLEQALDVARDSEGAFDPSVGSIVESWGFGPGRRVAAAAPACDWRAIELDRQRGLARRTAPVRLDFSAIAKGDAVDRLSALMTRLGLHDHLVEIGGELRGSGTKPDWSPWWVGLESPPHDDGRPVPARIVVALHGLAVATSGDYRQRVTRAGRRHSHTVDPRSGQPLGDDLAAVSVIHRSCRTADAISTALMVMGVDRGLDWATARDIAAVFRRRTPQGIVDIATPTLERWSQDPPAEVARAS